VYNLLERHNLCTIAFGNNATNPVYDKTILRKLSVVIQTNEDISTTALKYLGSQLYNRDQGTSLVLSLCHLKDFLL
jgi:hypothetical protein